MQPGEARALLASAITERGGTWIDLGAGSGVFTRALTEIVGPESRVFAVDRDVGALATLARQRWASAAGVVTVPGDFASELQLPGLDAPDLDGILVANALHFLRDAREALARFVAMLRLQGHVVIVEYDRRAANRWVPYPIPMARLPELVAGIGLSVPVVTATRPSAFGGDLYVASMRRVS